MLPYTLCIRIRATTPHAKKPLQPVLDTLYLTQRALYLGYAIYNHERR